MRNIILQAKSINKNYGERNILKEITLDIRNGERIGLVGWNGTGKTTLMGILMGLIMPDEGSVTRYPKDLSIGYLPQSTDYEGLLDEHMPEGKEELLLRATSRLGLEKLQNWETERYRNLSGGEKLKLALAAIWAKNPSLIFLDEPTNHLDLKGVNWLVDELNNFHGAAVIISHDRFFLDRSVTKVYEIEDGQLKEYEGNYTEYRNEKQRLYEQQVRDYDKQQRKIRMVEEQISTLKQWSEKAHRDAGKNRGDSENRQMGLKEFERVKAKKKDNQIKSKTKRLELELSKNKVEKPKEETQVLFDFEAWGKRGKRILEAEDLTKEFGDRVLFKQSHFYVKHGEKVGLLGSNGSGKTTFINMMMGSESISKGSLWKSDTLKIAYLSQDVSDMPSEKTAMEYLDFSGWERISKARTIFANMGMKEEKLLKPISTLSLGERTRVKLVKMIMQEYDVLILDEPTNHLDLPSRERLEETLESYQGTLIVVSHDRYFIEKLCDKLLLIEDHQIKRIEMGLKDYDEKQKEKMEPDKKEKQEMKAILDTKITELLGKISMLVPGTEAYAEMDEKLLELMKRKKEIG
ncbi:macrolide transport system ATP-binding/permease protein [Bacillus tianshenii]|uniref:Macrolide transport system ATP-binding/permease protein n=1 Tax=Sutcliffiella tianshenii TaxID=1463404 RepID=A0ABS2P4B3_9BACI|nr:ABC-F type ribosomal protection protein [Bacillus tianshenii]MBM7621548.1 macrolide transport system ATP-binding/permease protein [Bacillus tianshenii]